MSLSHSHRMITDQIIWIDLKGQVNLANSEQIKKVFEDFIAQNYYHFVVNLEKVEYVDSTGLGFLVRILDKLMAKNGSIEFVSANAEIRKIFNITSLDKLFNFHRSEADYMKALEMRTWKEKRKIT